jgi:glycosyltransferase involved in cell wall biosynthesis
LNVLLITFSFPPAGGVGVLRALSLAKYLPENNICVDVLTARNAPAVGKDSSLLQQVPASVKVHRCWTADLPFWLRKSVKKVVTGGAAKAHSTAVGPANGRGNPLKRLIGNLLLPDPQVGWLPFALSAAKRIIRDRKIDLVLITVPPFSTVRLATRLRKIFPALPIVVDFRDEWLSTTLKLVSFNDNSRAHMVAHKAEAEAVRDANAVVMVTEAAQQELQRRYPGVPAEKFHCIPNGFDVSAPAAWNVPVAFTPEQKTVLTYIGSVYGSTDPSTFVAAVRGLPEEVRSKLKVRFVGHIEAPAYREMLTSLGETVELKGFIPQAEALRAIQDTTYLLLITHDRINVAAKLYDYLGGGKPILGAVHKDGDVRRLLEETGTGWWADVNDVEAIRSILIEAIERQQNLGEAFRPNWERIGSYHRRPLAQRYAALLHKTAGAPRQS